MIYQMFLQHTNPPFWAFLAVCLGFGIIFYNGSPTMVRQEGLMMAASMVFFCTWAFGVLYQSPKSLVYAGLNFWAILDDLNWIISGLYLCGIHVIVQNTGKITSSMDRRHLTIIQLAAWAGKVAGILLNLVAGLFFLGKFQFLRLIFSILLFYVMNKKWLKVMPRTSGDTMLAIQLYLASTLLFWCFYIYVNFVI
jgi:hypothetical protein